MNYHCFSYNYNLQWILMDAVSSPTMCFLPCLASWTMKPHLLEQVDFENSSGNLQLVAFGWIVTPVLFIQEFCFFHSFCLEIHDHSRIRISLSGFICFYIVLLSVWGITVSCFVIILRLHTFQCQRPHLFLISFVPGAVYHAAWKNSTITTKVIEMSTNERFKTVKEQLLMWKVEEH